MGERPNPLLLTSALLYFVAAIALLFAPRELASLAGAAGGSGQDALLQVLGSALLGFSMLNWSNRYSRLGGILGRPLILANLAHAATAALLLVRVAVAPPIVATLVGATIVYAGLAIAFGAVLFRDPHAESP